VENQLDGTRNGHPAKLEYLANPNGHLSLVHVIQIQNETSGTWYEAFVDAHSGQLLSLTDFVSHATASTLSKLSVTQLNSLRATVYGTSYPGRSGTSEWI